MRSRGTKKPCHGCGAEGWRPVDEVCRDCKESLRRSREITEALEKNTELKHYAFAHAYYALPYIPKASLMGEDPGRDFQKAFQDLLKEIAVPFDTDRRYFAQGSAAVVDGIKTTDLSGTYSLAPAMRNLLNDLYQAAKEMARIAFENGKQEGQSLMLGLARGEVSIESFNKQAVGKITHENGK